MSVVYKIITLSLLFILAFTFGCKKVEESCIGCPGTGAPVLEDIKNVKHFFFFKVGSWWVYEEENSGARDSVYVISAIENTGDYLFDVRVESTYEGYGYHFWPQKINSSNCPDSGPISSTCVFVKRSKYKPGDFVGEGRCFIFVPQIGEFTYNWTNALPNNTISIEDIQNSMDLNGQTIKSRTIKLHELNTHMEGDQPTNHYFSENVGLVRKELLDSNEVWNLVDYYIVP